MEDSTLFTLDNGLRVAVRRAPIPLAAVFLRVDAGSADERPDEHGAAHFLEHMVFKGTPTHGVGEVAAAVEALGGDLNAYTTVDHTLLHATVPAESALATLEVIADMVLRSLLDPGETASEREVVLEEIRSYADDPASVAADAAVARLFPDHAYGHPVTGTEATVSRLDHEALRRFWARQWGPDRAVLAVAGDVDPETVREAAHRLFGDWAPASGPRHAEAPTEARPGWIRLTGAFDTPVAELGWRLPGEGHPDLPALDVACALLAQSSAGVLPVRLQLDQRLVADVWSAVATYPQGGALSIGMLPHPGKTREAVAETLDAIVALAAAPRAGDVRRARDSLLTDQLYSDETVDGIATDLAYWVATAGRAEAQHAYRAAIAAVSAEDVARVVRTWLDPERVVVVATEAAPRRARAVRRPEPPGPTRVTRDNGATVVMIPDGGPIASIRAVGLGGALAIDERHAGLGAAWAAMIGTGTGDLDAESYARAVDGLSGSITAIAGRSSIGLAGVFPSDRFREGLDLWGESLVDPAFEDEEWARVADELREDLRTLGDRPADVLAQRTWAALWRGHPWRLPGTGTEASIGRIHPGTLFRFHDTQLTADNLVVVVAGGFDPDEVSRALEPWLDELPSGPYRLAPRPEPEPPRGARVHARAGNEQAWVQLAARAPATTDPDRVALDVAMSVLGGQSGRLFLALRERRGLAYNVWATASPGWDGGVAAMGLATEPRQRARAVAALREEIERFAQEGPTEAELARTRAVLLGSAAIAWQRAAHRANEIALSERYGLPWGLDAVRRDLDGVTRESTREAVAALLRAGLVEIAVTPRRGA